MAKKRPRKRATVRDRIRELRRVKAKELVPHPKNWRRHPEKQRRAMRGILEELGYADALLARELPDGRLQLLDGHLRRELSPETEVPVLLVDLDDQEAEKLLVSFDPVTELSERDQGLLGDLREEIRPKTDGFQSALTSLFLEAQLQDQSATVELRSLETKPPPKMSWVLVGIATVRFGEIAETVEQLAGIDGTIVETTANDGPED